MASIIYNSFIRDLTKGLFDLDGTPTANVGVMLVTSTYTPNVDTHEDRADVTNEVTGGSYARVIDLTASINHDTANDRVIITLPGTNWPVSTITARAAVYFLDTGTAANDLLIAYNDFLGNITSTAGTFTLNSSTITLQNNNAVV
jgi:hypothetical protein